MRGSTAPALDRLRDAAREGEFDVLGVYSPDRLARRYAYQVLLLEEFRKAACDVEFVQRPISDDPHDQLLLQIQGAIAEYERAVLARAVPPRQAPEGPGRPVDRRPRPLRLPLRAQAGRRPGAPGGRRGRGRGGPDALPLADRRADDRPPDPQAAGRRPVAAPQRQAALVQRVVHRILSDPLYAGTAYANRLRFHVPPQAPLRRPPGGPADLPQARPREEWIPIPVPAIIDEATYQDASEQLARNSALSFRNNTRNDYLLRCLLTCRTCGLAMCGVTHRGAGRRQSNGTTYATARTRGPGPACRLPAAAARVEELDAAVWDHVKRLLDDPAALAGAVRGACAGQPRRGDARDRGGGAECARPSCDRARPRGAAAARRLPGRGDRPGRTQASDASRSRGARRSWSASATGAGRCAASGAGARRSGPT